MSEKGLKFEEGEYEEYLTKKLFPIRDASGRSIHQKLRILTGDREITDEITKEFEIKEEGLHKELAEELPEFYCGLAAYGSTMGGYSIPDDRRGDDITRPSSDLDVKIFVKESILTKENEPYLNRLHDKLDVWKALHDVDVEFKLVYIGEEHLSDALLKVRHFMKKLPNLPHSGQILHSGQFIEDELYSLSLPIKSFVQSVDDGKSVDWLRNHRQMIIDELSEWSDEEKNQFLEVLLYDMMWREEKRLPDRRTRMKNIDHDRILAARREMWRDRLKKIWFPESKNEN